MGRPRKAVVPSTNGARPKNGNGDLAVMAELLGAKPASSPVQQILLLHQDRPDGTLGVWYRLIRYNGTETTGWVTPADAELVEGAHGRAVQWLSRLGHGEHKRYRSRNGTRRDFSAEDRTPTHH